MSTPLQEQTSLSSLAKDHLLSASRWAKLLGSLLTIVLSIIMLVVLIFILTASSAMSVLGETTGALIFAAVMMYAGFIGFVVYVYSLLIGFGNKVKTSLQKKDPALLESGFDRLSTHFRLMTFVVMLSLVLSVLPLLLWLLTGGANTLFNSEPAFPDGNF